MDNTRVSAIIKLIRHILLQYQSDMQVSTKRNTFYILQGGDGKGGSGR